MKSSTTPKTKKKQAPRVVTRKEVAEKTLHIYFDREEGWVVVDYTHEIKSAHSTQAEAINKGRTIAKKCHGQLVIHKRYSNMPRKVERYWPDSVVFAPWKPIPPSFPPVNATRKEIERAVKKVIRERLAREAAQQAK